MGPEKPADAISKVLHSEIFPRFGQMGANFATYLTYSPAVMKQPVLYITIIHLNLNPPFKNPRSATEEMLDSFTL